MGTKGTQRPYLWISCADLYGHLEERRKLARQEFKVLKAVL